MILLYLTEKDWKCFEYGDPGGVLLLLLIWIIIMILLYLKEKD